MFLSVFDIFKIGIGPSSSHTMGPMLAAARFLAVLRDPDRRNPGTGPLARLRAELRGSLAFTGKGHATDRAVLLGFAGLKPAEVDPDVADRLVEEVTRTGRIDVPKLGTLAFDPAADIVFDYGPPLPGHANGLILKGLDAQGHVCAQRTYYSVGGGFVVDEEELGRPARPDDAPEVPYPFSSARQMLAMGRETGLTIAQMKRANELTRRSGRELDSGLDAIWEAMDQTIDRGLRIEGILPGGLSVRRRSKAIHDQLVAERGRNQTQPHVVNDWLSVYAMAVNEENAAGGRVVTSPTNGAAGVIPAVGRYWRDHCLAPTADGHRDYLLTAAAIGGLIKHNASISGAEVGCQGEVGSASAMAAAGLCAVLGGSNAQIENAAEIALEHHLGMTCDPVAGLVQVPCIERNALGAIKAVSAASLSIRGTGEHFMPLDNCIEAMRQTGREMDHKYKETSLGGLAVNLPEC